MGTNTKQPNFKKHLKEIHISVIFTQGIINPNIRQGQYYQPRSPLLQLRSKRQLSKFFRHGGNSTFINSFGKTKCSCFTLPPSQHYHFSRNQKFAYLVPFRQASVRGKSFRKHCSPFINYSMSFQRQSLSEDIPGRGLS